MGCPLFLAFTGRGSKRPVGTKSQSQQSGGLLRRPCACRRRQPPSEPRRPLQKETPPIWVVFLFGADRRGGSKRALILREWSELAKSAANVPVARLRSERRASRRATAVPACAEHPASSHACSGTPAVTACRAFYFIVPLHATHHVITFVTAALISLRPIARTIHAALSRHQ